MEWLYTGISWILLQWHSIWSAIGLGEWLNTRWDWVLAIVFLVLTIRGVLFPVFVKQIKSQRAMQALQPKITLLKEKYKGDRAGLQAAQMELMRAEKANPLMGCLPMLVQIPVFISLFHVLRHLTPLHNGDVHQMTLYGWSQDQFTSATGANLFGAPISASMRTGAADLARLGSTQSDVRIVAGVLIVIMIVTTFLTQRQMILKTGWATDPTQLMIQRLMMYGVPAGLIISGIAFPIGVVIYWVTTNLFSLGQQFYVLRKFPPPPTVNGRPAGKLFGNLFSRKTDGTGPQNGGRPLVLPAANGKAMNGKAALNGTPVVAAPKPGAKPVKTNGKAPAGDTPVAPTVAPPRVGAKPVNAKKGNASKRLPS